MKQVSVLLKTGDHCIETAAKNEFRRITDYFSAAKGGGVYDCS